MLTCFGRCNRASLVACHYRHSNPVKLRTRKDGYSPEIEAHQAQ